MTVLSLVLSVIPHDIIKEGRVGDDTHVNNLICGLLTMHWIL